MQMVFIFVLFSIPAESLFVVPMVARIGQNSLFA